MYLKSKVLIIIVMSGSMSHMDIPNKFAI